MEPTEDDYLFLPVGQAERPDKGVYFQRIADHWWSVHPDKGLVFYNPLNTRTGRRRHSYLGAPQCNTDERITRQVGKYAPFPVEVRLVPLVWVQISMHDYMRG